MPISLNSFLTHANSISEDRSLYVNSKGVQDTGKAGTVFTRAETFRQTTKAFLDAFTTEYGDRIGNIATKLLQHDLDAGTPLTALTVKNFVQYGNKEKELTASYEESCRNNIRAFIEDFTAEYGEHAGNIAAKLVQPDLKAGRALSEETIKQLKEYGLAEKNMHQDYEQTCRIRTDQAHQILLNIQHNRQDAEDMLMLISETPDREFTDLEIHLFQLAVQNSHEHLLEDAHLCEGDFSKQLVQDLKQGAHPFLEKAIDLILLTTNSLENGLVQDAIDDKNAALYDNPDVTDADLYDAVEQDMEQAIQDTFTILSLIEPTDTTAVDQDMLLNVLAALPQIRAQHPEGEITQEMIFQAVFPPKTTPTLGRPTPEEINQFTPAQMKDFLQKANQVFLTKYHADSLPDNSPFRGTGLNTEAGLERAKKLNIPPQTIASLQSGHVTLKDFPLLPLDLPINSMKLPQLDQMLMRFQKEISSNGTKGMATASVQPTITFVQADGNETTFKLGQIPGDDNTLTDDQKDYNAGRPSATAANMAYDLLDKCTDETQGALLLELLANDSRAPLVFLMQTFGDHGDMSIDSKFDYRITQQEDGSLQVDITTGKELEGFNGTGKLSYTISPDNHVSITDFTWDAPTPDQVQKALLTSTTSPHALPSLIAKSAADCKLSPQATALFTTYATTFYSEMIRQTGPHSAGFIQTLANEFPPKLHASNALKAIMQMSESEAFQELDETTQREQLVTLLLAIPQLEDTATELFSPPNIRQLYCEQAIGQLIDVMNSETAEGFTVTTEDLNALLPPNGAKALPELSNLIEQMKTAGCCSRALLLDHTDRTAFLKATSLFKAHTDFTTMNLFIEYKNQITQLHQTGQLDRQNLWQLLFQSPMPANIPTEDSDKPLPPNAISGKLQNDLMALGMQSETLKKMETDDAPLPALIVTFISCLSFGLKKDILVDFFRNGTFPQELTMKHCTEAGAICFSDSTKSNDPLDLLTNFNYAADQFYLDLCRMVDYDGTREDGTPFTSPNVIRVNLAGPNDMPHTLLHVQPNHLDPATYGDGSIDDPRKVLYDQLVSMVRNFCGPDHTEQATAALFCMGQAGQLPVLGQAFFGAQEPGRLHNQSLSITSDAQRNLHIRYQSVPDFPIDYAWDITITPDGAQKLTDIHMKKA